MCLVHAVHWPTCMLGNMEVFQLGSCVRKGMCEFFRAVLCCNAFTELSERHSEDKDERRWQLDSLRVAGDIIADRSDVCRPRRETGQPHVDPSASALPWRPAAAATAAVGAGPYPARSC